MAQQIQFRRGTAAEWTTYNPILAQGEMGIELDTKQYKIGDGVLTWSALPYGGITGAGVPVGGSVGQVVVKTGAGNYVTGWTTINKTTLGLGDVDNTSDANKPVSTAQAAANAAVQAYSIQRANHTGTQSASTITGLAAVATSGNKADVGLGNVDNTSDADKPISSATQSALDTLTTSVDGKQPLDDDLTAIAALTATGFVARTGAGAFSTRSIAPGTGIDITNQAGTTGDPSISLTDTGVVAATYGSTTAIPVLNVDAKGRITSASEVAITAGDIADFDEKAQDAVGGILTDTTTIDLSYNDLPNTITADVKPSSLTNAQINATAAIAQSKMAAMTASRAVITDASGFATTNATTSTEVGYLTGVTSAIQTQLDGKYPNPTGTTADYIRGDGSLALFPTLAQADRLVTTVRNQTGSLIPAGSVVYINGSSGTNPTITLALADSDINSAKTYGLTSAAIANNSTGLVVAMGRLQNINTSAFLAGASIYLSPTVPGGYTATKPSAPNHLVAIGFIIRSHPTQGEIEVKIINGFELGELHDVAISATPVTGQSLYYDSVTDLWSNQTPPMSITGQMAVSLETAVVALTDAATIAINATLGNTFTVTLGGNRTLDTPTNPSSGQKIIVRVTQDGTGGRTITYSAGWNLGSDFAGLSLSTTPGATDYIGAIYNAITSKWDIVSIMRGY